MISLNIFKNRPLVCIAFSFLSSLFIFSVIDNRIPYIIAYISFALTVGAVLVAYRLFKKFPFTYNTVLALVCLTVTVISSLMPLFMFNVKFSDNSLDGETVNITACVTKINTEQSDYASFTANVTAVNSEKCDFTATVFTEFSPQIKVGDIFTTDATLESLDDSLYYSPIMRKRQMLLYSAICSDSEHFVISGHKTSFVSYINSLGDRLGYKFDRLLSPQASSLAKALLLGDRYDLSDVVVRNFRRSGISHLIALSGMHLALIIGFIMFFINFIVLNSKARFIIVIILTVFIMLITGASPSILRAGIMLIYYQAGYLLRDKTDPLTALFATVTFIVISDPYAILDAGLILSFAATFGITLFMRIFQKASVKLFGNPFKQVIPLRIVRYIFDGIMMSFSAGVFVTLASVFLFDSISVLSVITTLIFSPLIVAFMITSAFSLIFVSKPVLSGLFISLSELLCEVITDIASYCSRLNGFVFSAKPIVIYTLAALFIIVLAFFVIRNFSIKHFLVFSAVFSLISLITVNIDLYVFRNDNHISIVSDGENDSFVISDGRNSMIADITDGSSESYTSQVQTVYNYLDTDIDCYLLTHYHYNHIKALKGISDYTLIRKLYLPVPQNETDKEYSEELEALCKSLKIETHYYDLENKPDFNNITIQPLKLDRVKSTHPRIAFSIEAGDTSIVYTGSYNEKCADFAVFEKMLESADILIKGSHGVYENDVEALCLKTDENCTVYLDNKYISDGTLVTNQKILPHFPYEIAEFSPE